MVKSSISALPVGIWPPSAVQSSGGVQMPPARLKCLKRLQSIPKVSAVKELSTTIDDFMDSAIERLSDWPPLLVEHWTEKVGDLISRGIRIAEDQPEVAGVLKMLPRDKRSPWTALCALLALYADSIHNEHVKFQAGLEVWLAKRQAREGGRKFDALSRAILNHIKNHPNATDEEIFEHFAAVAGNDKTFPVKRYDEIKDELSYKSEPGRSVEKIDREAFCRRVRRVRAWIRARR